MRFKVSIYLAAIFVAISCVSPEQSAVSVRKVKCETLQPVESSSTNRAYSGRVEAVADVNLSFRVAGVVDRVLAKEGDFVRKNQVVAELDSRDYELQLSATQAEYDAVKGEVDRVVELHGKQSVADNDYDKAVSGLKQITAKLDAHRNALEDTRLKAPFDGYVQHINFNRGEALSAGMPIMSFVSSSTPKITIDIPVSEYLRRDDLLSANATFKSYPDLNFVLKPIGVAHKANLNQLFESHFIIESQDGVTPTPGMLAMVTLRYADESAAMSIPMSAVVERDGKSYVWVVNGGVASLRSVEVGRIMRSGRAVIEGGLGRDEMVITAGVSRLKEGDRVDVLPAATKSNIGNIL